MSETTTSDVTTGDATTSDATASAPTVVWLRDDLRLADNPALHEAVQRGGPVIVLYVLDEESAEVRELGGATRWWLHLSLEALGASIEALGGRLVLRRGAAERVVPEVVADAGAGAVLWNRRYGQAREIDARLKERLRDGGVEADSFQANLLVEPWTLRTATGGPYKVYTPYWKALQQAPFRDELPAPEALPAPAGDIPGDALDDWGLLPTTPDWAGGLRETWRPGEAGAHDQLEEFIADRLADYHRRDEPAIDATSHLSPHLHFGELSPLQIWNRLHEPLAPPALRNREKFLSEVAWREFNTNILFNFPQLRSENYRPDFDDFPWQEVDEQQLEAWRRGRTGIPLVDAGMRELWHTGRMHNRVRMVCASFLVKNLLVDWRIGEAWFWDTLVDADEANNAANWQWVAGSGADAAPYFRVFNPALQAKKFDPQGAYIARWVPEAGTPEYPEPIVDLAQSRRDALDAYESIRARVR